MNKRRISSLLLAACLAMPLAACGDAGQGAATKTLKNYFEWNAKQAVYSEVVRIDGKVIASNNEHNLLAIEVTGDDPYSEGNIRDSIVVLDMEDVDWKNFKTELGSITDNANTVWTYNTSYSANNTTHDTYDVDLDGYPLVHITRKQSGENGKTYHSYYLAKSNGSQQIGTEVEENEYGDWEKPDVDVIHGFYEITFENSVYWVDENLNILRTMNKDVTDGYYMSEGHFFGAHDGMLYAYDFETARMIQVYNKEGVCSMQYTFPSDVVALGMGSDGVMMLPWNGGILVQEVTLAEDGEAYNFTLMGMKANVTTKLIDSRSGEVTVLEMNAFVSLADEDGFLPVKENEYGQKEYALVNLIPFNQLGMASSSELGVMDYTGEVVYKVRNDYMQFSMGDEIVQTIGSDKYLARLYRGESYYTEAEELLYVFDLNGNKKAMLPANTLSDGGDYYVTDTHYVTKDGIFNYSGTCVYPFNKLFIEDKVMLSSEDIEIVGNDIYFYGWDLLEGFKEESKFDDPYKTYKFNPSTNKLDEVAGYDSQEIYDLEEDYSVYKDVFKGTYTLYNTKGVALLKWQGHSSVQEGGRVDINEGECGEYVWLETKIGSTDVIYIVK